MPIFRYHCRNCGAEFELLLLRSDEKAECPSCRSVRLEKRPTSFSSSVKTACGSAASCPNAHSCCGGNCGCHR